jgi:hypothetical protein
MANHHVACSNRHPGGFHARVTVRPVDEASRWTVTSIFAVGVISDAPDTSYPGQANRLNTTVPPPAGTRSTRNRTDWSLSESSATRTLGDVETIPPAVGTGVSRTHVTVHRDVPATVHPAGGRASRAGLKSGRYMTSVLIESRSTQGRPVVGSSASTALSMPGQVKPLYCRQNRSLKVRNLIVE